MAHPLQFNKRHLSQGEGAEWLQPQRNQGGRQIKQANGKLQLFHYGLAISMRIDHYCSKEQQREKENGEETGMLLVCFCLLSRRLQ